MARTPVMMLGCTSDAGKSFLVTGLCRALSNRGFRVAPFKGQNMSNNAAVTTDGFEIGRAQYTQALAARVVADVRMNPVLLKPLSDTRGAVILNGRPAPEVEALPWLERPRLTWPVVASSLHSLVEEFDIVVIEGAGSPAEVNLRASDIVNTRVAKEVRAHTYLCSDIDRGGSFAHLLGTWHCLEPDERALLRGFVLNRFRGDPLLLGDATSWLEGRTGVPTVAVVPWIHHQLPEEDRLVVRNVADDSPAGGNRPFGEAPGRSPGLGTTVLRIAIVLYPFASNTDEFDALGTVPGVEVSTIRSAGSLERFDAVVLPGSRNVAASARWLEATGIAASLSAHVEGGNHILGVCGGMQILGLEVRDPHGLEGGDLRGLGLLGVTTELAADKTTRAFHERLLPTGDDVVGYEIHHGVTSPVGPSGPGSPDPRVGHAEPIFDRDLGWRQGNVVGVYAHALLEDPGFRSWWLRTLGPERHVAEPEPAPSARSASSVPSARSASWAATLDAEFDRVADLLETTGFVDHVLGNAG